MIMKSSYEFMIPEFSVMKNIMKSYDIMAEIL